MNSQAIADAHPRMTEPTLRKVPCDWCNRLVDEFEQDETTGEVMCVRCLEDEGD